MEKRKPLNKILTIRMDSEIVRVLKENNEILSDIARKALMKAYKKYQKVSA